MRRYSGDRDGALEDFSEAIRLLPKAPAAWELRGQLHFDADRYEDALADFTEALKNKPDSVRLYNRRGQVHYFQREYAKAIRDHMEALKIDPKDAYTFNFLAWIWATAPVSTIRNANRSFECATRACELTEFEEPSFLDTLAAAHAECGRFDEAIHWAEKAIELVDETTAEDYGTRLELFREHQPVRVTPERKG